MAKLTPKKWIISFFAIVLAVVLLLSALVFVIDPFFQFRTKDNAYELSSWFVGGGLLRNYDYDTLIVGSSMIFNFDMDVFREELGAKPLHIGLGGIRLSEVKDLMEAAYAADRAERYYICVDLPTFAKDAEPSRYAQYLLRDDPLSRMRYFLSYEVWFRYIPVDLALMLADKAGVSLPEKIQVGTSIDRLEDSRLDLTYNRKTVIKNYKSNRAAVSDVDLDHLYERMCSNVDDYLDGFDYTQGEHIFFFPPYSSLFWCNAQDRGYFEDYLSAKQYFMERAAELGVTVFDFQTAELTMDLENYTDTTHFSPEINDWMTRCFASGAYLATKESAAAAREQVVANTAQFRQENADVFQ